MVIRIRNFPEYFASRSKNEKPQISTAILISTEKILMRDFDSRKSERYSVDRKGNDQKWRFPNHRNIVIGEAKMIRFRNAYVWSTRLF